MKCLLLFCILTTVIAHGADEFAAEKKDDRLVITRGGRPVAHFVFKDAAILRPYFAHVHTPAGVPVTRTHPPVAGTDPVDHATMHPGIWLAFGDVSGHDFWRNKAAIRHEKFTQEPVVKDGVLTFATLSGMIPADGEPLAEMACTFTFDAKHVATQITWQAAFTPLRDGFSFGDQEEMGLGVRMATALSEKNGGGIESSTGKKTAAATWGQPADWCDYTGKAGDKECGITLLTSPGNFRASWFHNRDYGLMVANPFGQKAMTKQGEPSRVPVAKGATLKLAFRVILHDEADIPALADSAQKSSWEPPAGHLPED
jgi:Methane oxygenase PmoA